MQLLTKSIITASIGLFAFTASAQSDIVNIAAAIGVISIANNIIRPREVVIVQVPVQPPLQPVYIIQQPNQIRLTYNQNSGVWVDEQNRVYYPQPIFIRQ